MFKTKRIYTLLLLLALFFIPIITFAQENEINFEAKIIEIIDEQEKFREDGSKMIQQNIRLEGLTGDWKNKEVIFYGISKLEVTKTDNYKVGNKVIVNYQKDIEGNNMFYIIDHVRRSSLYLLVLIFVILVIIVGGLKGFKSLISLVVSFLVILKFIAPQILNGSNPVIISIIGSFAILIAIIYITEGFNKKSHLSLLSIAICLAITSLLLIAFNDLINLTGTAQEEASYLMTLGYTSINFKGLLLAAMLIGTLGILDDIVISQMETINQIKKANKTLTKKEIFKAAFSVGKSHISAVINTLFLAYAGASLSLILLFSVNTGTGFSLNEIINNEAIATEIVRTLVGSIGLVLAMPISTFLGTWFYKVK